MKRLQNQKVANNLKYLQPIYVAQIMLEKMNQEIIKVIALVAGIGGVAIGGMVIIFRDVIRKNIFPTLTRQHAFEIIRLIVVLSFVMALVGIGAWIYSRQPNQGLPKPFTDLDSLSLFKKSVVLAARAQIEKAKIASENAQEAAKDGEQAAIAAQAGEPNTIIFSGPCQGYSTCYQYRGEWDPETRKPHGFGVMIYLFKDSPNLSEKEVRDLGISGEKFSGAYKQGVRVRGVYNYPLPFAREGTHPYGGALKYEGDWAPTPTNKAANWNGYGTVKYRDGTIYRGQIIDGSFSGYGILSQKDKTRVEGNWRDGRPVENEFVAYDVNGEPINDYHWPR
jgi:hypothetical protein